MKLKLSGPEEIDFSHNAGVFNFFFVLSLTTKYRNTNNAGIDVLAKLKKKLFG